MKTLRVLLALLFFLPITLCFVDFAGLSPWQFKFFPEIQIVPAILAGAVTTLIVLGILTLLFGRLYCSIICPFGVLQDIIAWFTKRGKKKNRKKRWYNYHKPYTIVRYTLLTICGVFLLLGNLTPLLFLDPYSNFGRIGVNLLRPVVMEGNNALNWIALQFNNYNFYQVTIYTVTTASFLIALLCLLIVGALAVLRGRLFCNAICPVGSLLGLISKWSLFRVQINQESCTKCGLCEKACKAQCIDSKNKYVDGSRCVTCFNCLDRCKQGGVKYRFAYAPAQQKEASTNLTADNATKQASRRKFIVTGTAIAASLPVLPALAQAAKEKKDVTKLTPITPPGSISLERFKDKCTACHLCITHCPQQILKPAGFTFGLNYAFKPHLSFYEMAFCNYECNTCSQICPNDAIKPLTVEEKKVTSVGIAQFDKGRCIVYTENTSCGACSEHCPVQAVKMEPYLDGLTLPHVYDELCIGCGGCESICPVRPVKAINILANAVHHTALKPVEEEIEEVKSEELDFGF
jgi:ferredoxin